MVGAQEEWKMRLARCQGPKSEGKVSLRWEVWTSSWGQKGSTEVFYLFIFKSGEWYDQISVCGESLRMQYEERAGRMAGRKSRTIYLSEDADLELDK